MKINLTMAIKAGGSVSNTFYRVELEDNLLMDSDIVLQMQWQSDRSGELVRKAFVVPNLLVRG